MNIHYDSACYWYPILGEKNLDNLWPYTPHSILIPIEIEDMVKLATYNVNWNTPYMPYKEIYNWCVARTGKGNTTNGYFLRTDLQSTKELGPASYFIPYTTNKVKLEWKIKKVLKLISAYTIRNDIPARALFLRRFVNLKGYFTASTWGRHWINREFRIFFSGDIPVCYHLLWPNREKLFLNDTGCDIKWNKYMRSIPKTATEEHPMISLTRKVARLLDDGINKQWCIDVGWGEPTPWSNGRWWVIDCHHAESHKHIGECYPIKSIKIACSTVIENIKKSI